MAIDYEIVDFQEKIIEIKDYYLVHYDVMVEV